MILALNIGNSNITFGSYTPDGKLVFSSRLFADTALSSDELLYKMVNMLALYGAEPQEITAIIFSSVVPALTPRIREALRKMCEAPVMEVGPGLKSGVRIRMDNPAQLGGELLCAVVGALRRAEPPLVVVNFDTAQLPQVELEAKPRRLLGTNTADCLHSGIVHGTSAMLDGMVAQFRAALHADAAPVIATGTLPYSVRDCCVTEITYRETLILDGLFAIWQRNTRR